MEKKEQNDPLHWKNLEAILTELVETLGWEAMGQRIKIRCFVDEPAIGQVKRAI